MPRFPAFDLASARGTLMVQGCTSDAGKSTLVAGLCRVFRRRGVAVVPFKPQNMALNSAVTADGGEIGRAQALQAQAAGLAPHTDMNPVLLKPGSDTGAQVIIHGHVRGDMEAGDYHRYKTTAMAAVLESHARLAAAHDLVLVEGAGSPAEVNLRERDIANMGFAEAVDCPVILVADIDRGGVFAHFVGTLDCLSASERARIVGFVVNRFRGDPGLLVPGLEWLEQRTGKPVLGVLPYLHGLHLDAEDAIQTQQAPQAGPVLRVVVPVLPRVSNHTDFDALRAHPQVDLRFVGPGDARREADLIILPGSKNTRADLAWLREQGWEATLQRHLRYGGKLLGLCGGFQMLGETVDDPRGVEGPAGVSAGFGLLPMHTVLASHKQLRTVRGRLDPRCLAPVDGDPDPSAGPALAGYEIHVGTSHGPALARPALWLEPDEAPDASPVAVPDTAPVAAPVARVEAAADVAVAVTARAAPERRPMRPDGALSADGRILGTYVHGLFDAPQACAALLRWAGLAEAQAQDLDALREASIERLADAIEAALGLQ